MKFVGLVMMEMGSYCIADMEVDAGTICEAAGKIKSVYEKEPCTVDMAGKPKKILIIGGEAVFLAALYDFYDLTELNREEISR